MSQAGDGPLKELALAGHLDGLGLDLAPDGPLARLGSFFPDRMTLDSQWNRRPAMAKPITVTTRPMMISDGHERPPIWDRSTETVTECERHLGFRCGHEDSGATTSGGTWGSDRSIRSLGDPCWTSEPRPCETQAGRSTLVGDLGSSLVVRVCPACRFAEFSRRSSEAEHQLPKLTRVDSRRPLSQRCR